jgi:hypothetical protein
MPKLSFLSTRAFDAGLAALAAVSAGFLAFAMPESLFSSLVETSRLPEFVPAAQPPLGDTARLAAAGAALLVAFAATWAILSLLGRWPERRKPEAEAESEAPRLRRADAHPDAPARRPLLARDLGEPLDLDDFPQAAPESEPAVEAGHRPLPSFLVPQDPQAEPVDEAEPEAVTGQAERSEPEALWTPPEPEWALAEPEPEPEQPLPISKLAAQLPDVEEEGEEESDQSLSQLVGRIEFGLSRKRQALPAAADVPPSEFGQPEPEKIGHRLRSAINDLQKIASNGG